MTSESTQNLRRITVDVQVGDDRMAASDDPIFLGLRGPAGREFRLVPAKGKAFRRGATQHVVLAGPEDDDTNVARPDLNDPTRPAVDLSLVTGVYLRKALDPIPNVRGHGEMDDRLQVKSIRVELQPEGGAPPRHFARGDFWLGLVCGLVIDLPPADGDG